MTASSSQIAFKEDCIEREMGRHQRGLVDTCFEEGQYLSGIDVLQQMLSAGFKPSEEHIRQLLYIALYPPPLNDERGKEKEPETLSPTKRQSPSKQQQQSPFIPSPAAAAAAQRLLLLYTNSNTPKALFRALPEHPLPSAAFRELGLEREDSFIASESLCIAQCTNCWTMLKRGFIKRRQVPLSMPKRKRTRRQIEYLDDELDEPESEETVSLVAEHAWPVLEWLVRIFEQDELSTEKSGLPRHSPFLLTQIPPPRTSGPRWEANSPLDIVFHCFQLQDHRRKALGARLMSLLVNLTSTVTFDIYKFTTLVYNYLSSAPESSSALFSALPTHQQSAVFKVNLCKQFILGASPAETSHLPAARPKPQARAIRAARRNKLEEAELSSVSEPTDGSYASKVQLPDSAEILRLLENGREAAQSMAVLETKLQLVISYGFLQRKAGEGYRDTAWRDVVHTGKLNNAVESAFGNENGLYFRSALKGIIAAW